MLQHDFSDRRPAAAISKGVEGLNTLHWVVTVLAGSAPTRRILLACMPRFTSGQSSARTARNRSSVSHTHLPDWM